MKKYIYITTALLISGLFIYTSILKTNLIEERSRAERFEGNFRITQDTLTFIRAKNGDMMARIEALQFSEKELKTYNKDLTKRLKERDIRIKDLQTALNISSQTEVDITIPRRDTMIKLQPVSMGTYKDKWNSLTGVITKDSINFRFSATDSLYIYHHIQKHKFLCIRWGKKAEWWDISNKNPFIKISGFKVVQVNH